MKIKSVIPPTLFISTVIALNGIATAIDTPQVYQDSPVQTPKMVVIENPIFEMIEDIAVEYGLDMNIIKAIVEEESNFYPGAIGDDGESLGLMQIQPRWHQARMERLGITNLMDPVYNTIIGCDIIAELYQQYGNYMDALSVYNSGNTVDGREYAQRILDRASKYEK